MARRKRTYELPMPTKSRWGDIVADYSANPLMMPPPRITDVRQGALGNCAFMSCLAGIAHFRRAFIYQMIGEVKWPNAKVTFHARSGAYHFVVSPDLHTFGTHCILAYAKPGKKTNAMWAPLVEKAYCQFMGLRRRQNTYATIDKFISPCRHLRYLMGRSCKVGSRKASGSGVVRVLDKIYKPGGHEQKGFCVIATNRWSIGPVMARHAYLITDWNYGTMSMTLYNPWSKDGVKWDRQSDDGFVKLKWTKGFAPAFTRIWYCWWR